MVIAGMFLQMTKNNQKLLQKATACLLLLFLMAAKCNAQGAPPTIAVQPVGISVQNGGTTVITVVANPVLLATVTFTWYCNNQPVKANSNITIVTTSTNSILGLPIGGLAPVSILTIKNTNPTNAGTYYVTAKDSLSTGTTTSSNATIIVLSTVVTNIINILTSASALTTAGFHLQMSTPTGSNVVVEASSDMVNWTPIYTNLNSSGTLTYMDTGATNHTSRYYRARTQ
jgi:hypothetical protein